MGAVEGRVDLVSATWDLRGLNAEARSQKSEKKNAVRQKNETKTTQTPQVHIGLHQDRSGRSQTEKQRKNTAVLEVTDTALVQGNVPNTQL